MRFASVLFRRITLPIVRFISVSVVSVVDFVSDMTYISAMTYAVNTSYEEKAKKISTLEADETIPRRVGRKKLWTDEINGRFMAGTKARIDAVRLEGEDRSDFLRAAVEAELKRREIAITSPPSLPAGQRRKSQR